MNRRDHAGDIGDDISVVAFAFDGRDLFRSYRLFPRRCHSPHLFLCGPSSLVCVGIHCRFEAPDSTKVALLDHLMTDSGTSTLLEDDGDHG